MSAIDDALSDYGYPPIEMPATPLKIWNAIQDYKNRHKAA
jgi:hypothetical protein